MDGGQMGEGVILLKHLPNLPTVVLEVRSNPALHPCMRCLPHHAGLHRGGQSCFGWEV